MQQYLIEFLFSCLKILSEMAPYLLLGFLFAGILHAFVPKNKIEKYFNGNPIKTSILASLFGIPLPLCSCGVIPTGMAFYKNGASKGATVSFLISTPQTGVDSILATFSLMGLPFAIIRPIAALVTGISGGILTDLITKKAPQTNQTTSQKETIKLSFSHKLISVFKYGFIDFIQDISKWLIIGLLLAAIISSLIPNDYFALLNLSPFLQMLLILIISIPFYICATGSIPLAMILIMKGISPGAAFVLLMAGPATNAATITMIGNVLGRKSLFTYLGTIIIGAISFGLMIDYAFPTEWLENIANQHLNHQHGETLKWWEIGSGILLVGLMINAYFQSKKTIEINTQNMNIQTIKVDGMTCNHCKNNVETNLEKLDFIDSASVNLAEKSVTIEGDHLELEKAKELINSLGYKTIS